MKISLVDNKFQIELDREETESKSGKSTVLASTHGNRSVALPNGEVISVGINIYQKHS